MPSDPLDHLRRRVSDLEADVRRLRAENEVLRRTLLVCHEGAIWRRRPDGGFDGPHCLACWTESGALTWLKALGADLGRAECPSCGRASALPRPPA